MCLWEFRDEPLYGSNGWDGYKSILSIVDCGSIADDEIESS